MSSKKSTQNRACIPKKDASNHGSKKQTKRTESKDNAKPEVFVLPPNLLEQLGINLGNIANPTVFPAPENSAGVNSQNRIANHVVHDAPKPPVEATSKHTSILETAILMKKSVFLSPTFIPSGSQISGELEMSIEADTSYTGDIEPYVDKEKYGITEDFPGGGNVTLNEPEQSKVSKSEFGTDLSIQYAPDQAQVNYVIESSNILLPNVIENGQGNIDNTVIIHDKKETMVDDHQDEAYLSDCSSSDFSPVQNSTDSMSPVCLQTNKNQDCNHSDKIKILSSKTLSPTQIKKLKNKRMSKNIDFVPVSVNTVISMKNQYADDSSNMISENSPMSQILSNSNKDTDETLNSAVFDENDAAQQLIELADIITQTVGNADTALNDNGVLPAELDENYYFGIDTDQSHETETESQIKTKDMARNAKALDTGNIDVNSDMSIDYMVNNLEENEEILDNFVKHLDLNDSSDILDSIEKIDVIDDTDIVTEDFVNEKNISRENTSVSTDDEKIEIVGTSTSNNYDLKNINLKHDNLKLDQNYDKVHILPNNQNSNQLGIKTDSQKSIVNKLTKKLSQTKLDKYFTKNNTNVGPRNESKNAEINPATQNVQEIAMLLCQLTKKRHSTTTHSKVVSENTKIKDFNSKLCTDTVKQPGGLEKKEYKRNINVELAKAKANISEIRSDQIILRSAHRTNVPKVYSRKSVTKSQNIDMKTDVNANPENEDNHFKFCNCGDFGIFAYYDCNSLYEHIHFWDHRSTNCTNEDIFRIYEDYDAVRVADTFDKMDSQDGLLESSPIYDICWNSIGIGQSEYTYFDNAVQSNITDNTKQQNEVDTQKPIRNATEIQKTVEENADIQTIAEVQMSKTVKENVHLQKPIVCETEIRKIVEKETETQQPVGKKTATQKLVQMETLIQNPVQKEKEKTIEKIVAVAPKQIINKHACDPQYTTEINQINSDSKIEIKKKTCAANATVQENMSESVGADQELEHALIKKGSTNDHDVQEVEEPVSVFIVIDDNDRDMPKETGDISPQCTPKEVVTGNNLTKENIISVENNDTVKEKVSKKKQKCKSATHLNAEQSLMSETDVIKDAPTNKLQKCPKNVGTNRSEVCDAEESDLLKTTRNSRKGVSKGSAVDEGDLLKTTRNSRKGVSKGSAVDEGDLLKTTRNSRKDSSKSSSSDQGNLQKTTRNSRKDSSQVDASDERDFQSKTRNLRKEISNTCGADQDVLQKTRRSSRKDPSKGGASDEVDLQNRNRSSRKKSLKDCDDQGHLQKTIKNPEKEPSKADADLQTKTRDSKKDSSKSCDFDQGNLQKIIENPKKKQSKADEGDRKTKTREPKKDSSKGCENDQGDLQKTTKNPNKDPPIADEGDLQQRTRNPREDSPNDCDADVGDLQKKTRKSKKVPSENCAAHEGDLQQRTRISKRISSKVGATDDDAPLSSMSSRKRRSVPNVDETEPNIKRRSSIQPSQKMITCGVCNQNMDDSQWIPHIAEKHEYLAWKDGEPPLDVNDDYMLQHHLNIVSKQAGNLTCSSCGFIRKSAKAYLQHKRKCGEDNTNNESIDTSNTTAVDDVDIKPCVKCGVCQETVLSKDWITHIQRFHDYMAWKDGETLDVNDETVVYDHLHAISKETGKLVCPKCGQVRVYVKKYLDHFKSCDAVRSDLNLSLSNSSDQVMFSNETRCGVCGEKVNEQDWVKHKMIEHYNVAWIEGEIPVDKKNPYAVERLLKEYQKKYHTLICKICGLTRASCMGFYAHIIVCGKTEQETEEYKVLCSLCNKKYLCIYHAQHMAWHKTAEASKERQAILKEKRESDSRAAEEDSLPTPGKRKAAQKAIAVIENYNTENQKCKHICNTCGFGTDVPEELELHQARCIKAEKSSDDGDESVDRLEEESSSSDELSGIDSDSDMAVEDDADTVPHKRNKHKRPDRELDNTIRFPRVTKDPKKFLLKSGEQFYEYHLSGENLFPEWRTSKYEAVPEENVKKYMDSVENSCKVQLNGEWLTYSKFEAKKDKGFSLFVGSSIQCVSWAPPADDTSSNYLAVACHRGMDCPRLLAEQTPSYPGLIQIWDFNTFDRLPHFAFGLAHDCGTVWALDWCPSGAQDPLSDTLQPDGTLRMGLLATACSNGAAYIYAVPHPSTFVQGEGSLYKLVPVVELRLSMGSERKKYQATALRWSPQKGHTLIVVGYGDGTTAYYDLNTVSPLLKTKENDLTVIYPYHDERLLASCLSAVDVYPSTEAAAVGLVCGGGATGAATTRGPHCAARLATRLACHDARFEPLWPAVMLTSDSALTLRSSITELEWSGKGRCVGGGGAAAMCGRCARAAVFAPPLVRLLRPHPTAYELEKKTVGSLQTVDLVNVPKKRKLDDFAVVKEPTTYEKAVKIYGIEFKQDRNLQPLSVSKSRDTWSERYPLADIVSMTFCPGAAHHHRLAIATFAGVVFVVDTP